jgi:hypothetical protein
LLNQQRSKIKELAEERSSDDNSHSEEDEVEGTSAEIPSSEYLHHSKEKSSGGMSGGSKVTSQLLSQMYREKNYKAIASLCKTEKTNNRFVTVDTEFIDMINLNTNNIMNDM